MTSSAHHPCFSGMGEHERGELWQSTDEDIDVVSLDAQPATSGNFIVFCFEKAHLKMYCSM